MAISESLHSPFSSELFKPAAPHGADSLRNSAATTAEFQESLQKAAESRASRQREFDDRQVKILEVLVSLNANLIEFKQLMKTVARQIDTRNKESTVAFR